MWICCTWIHHLRHSPVDMNSAISELGFCSAVCAPSAIVRWPWSSCAPPNSSHKLCHSFALIMRPFEHWLSSTPFNRVYAFFPLFVSFEWCVTKSATGLVPLSEYNCHSQAAAWQNGIISSLLMVCKAWKHPPLTVPYHNECVYYASVER